MIRNKRAFPYQVQGLETSLMISGEFDPTQHFFVMDKDIEHKIYLLTLTDEAGAYSYSQIIDLTNSDDVVVTITDNANRVIQLRCGEGSSALNHIDVILDDNNALKKGFIVRLYEIPLLPKGSVN